MGRGFSESWGGEATGCEDIVRLFPGPSSGMEGLNSQMLGALPTDSLQPPVPQWGWLAWAAQSCFVQDQAPSQGQSISRTQQMGRC